MLTYYFEILFLDENYEVLYKHYLNFLFDNMTSFSDGFNGLQVQATDCISYLFHQKSLVSRFDSYINNPETNILMRLIDYTMYAKLEKYFDIIYDIVTLYEVKLINDQNSSLSLIRALVARYMQEEEEGSNEPNIIISKIWNILIAMAERKKYVMALLPQLEESLTPLFKSMTFDSIVLYEDEVMTWMNSVMKITKEPTPLISELFKLVPQFLEKDGYVMSKHVLEALNLLITYDTKQIAINEDSIHELLSMAIRVLSPSKESATEVDSAHGALLLQLIIQVTCLISL